MKNFLLLFILSLVSFCFFSCGNQDSELNGAGTEQVDTKHYGFWYTSIDNEVYSIYLDKSGSAIIKIYKWENSEWTEQEKKAAYTLNSSNGEFILKLTENAKAIIGTMTITGSNMSVKSDDKITMLTKYSGVKSDLSAVFKDIEDNWIDTTPGQMTTEQNIFDTPEAYEHFTAAIYASAREFARYQLFVENYILNYKNTHGDYYPLRADDIHFENLWQKGYKAISYTNTLIEGAANKPEYKKYYEQAIAIRAFVYYNMAMLWGNVPYVSRTYSADEVMTSNNTPQVSTKSLFNTLLADINKIKLTDVTGSDHFNSLSLNILRIEINITLSNMYQISMTGYNNDVFCFLETEDNMVNVMGATTPIYTKAYCDLLMQESGNDKESLIAAWNKLGEYKYGYWAMLKRIGKAEEMAKLQPHELLLPIPQRELDYIPYLKQNPGY